MLSIITPVFNGQPYIQKNIDSIKQLSIPHEHIIVDGGSTDGTLEILNNEKSIKLLHQKEKTGMYGAIDIGFKNALGDIICWVNCDDIIEPLGYEKLFQFTVTNKFDFVSSNGIIINSNKNSKRLVKSTRFIKYFLSKGFFPFLQPSVVYRKELYNKVNGLNFHDFKICGDLDLFYRMSKVKEAKFAYLPVVTAFFLIHGNSLGDMNSDLAKTEQRKSSIPSQNIILRGILKTFRIFGL